jgi:hypothetical protein
VAGCAPVIFAEEIRMEDSNNDAPATKQDLLRPFETVIETMRDIETHMITEFRRYELEDRIRPKN